jgi:Cu+-exporting ATPase
VPDDGAERIARPALPGWITLIFAAAVALLILIEAVGERLGLFKALIGHIPAPLAILAVLVGGYPIFRNVAIALRNRNVTAHALMMLGVIGALAIGQVESAAVIVFFMRFADWLEGYTTDRSRQAIAGLMKLAPHTAHVARDGQEHEIAVDQVVPGDVVIVRPGERIPVDGQVLDGRAAVDQAPITGESIPVEKAPGDTVFAATVAQAGFLRIETTRVGADTTLGRIIRLVEEAEANKAPVQRFADRFTAYYIPVVASVSALTFLISRDVTAAIAVLLVACACAVALATPMAVVASVGRAAREGILIKGGRTLEALAQVDTLLVDKTGTLTFGTPAVTDLVGRAQIAGWEAQNIQPAASDLDLLRLAASAERYSEHPLAGAVVAEARARGLTLLEPDQFEVAVGRGVTARLNGSNLLVGNRPLLAGHGVSLPDDVLARAEALEAEGKTVLFVAALQRPASDGQPRESGQPGEEGSERALDGGLLGLIAVSDVLRSEVPATLAELQRLGIRRTVLLTGDNERVAQALARRLGVEYRAELLPEDKIAFVRQLQAEGQRVAMVGDGINDAPALAAADVGIAMGVAGSDVAIEAADVALLRDDWRLVPDAMRIGRRTFGAIKQNLAIGVLYNVVGLSLAAVGLLPPVLAAAGQSIPDVAILLNASRLLRR